MSDWEFCAKCGAAAKGELLLHREGCPRRPASPALEPPSAEGLGAIEARANAATPGPWVAHNADLEHMASDTPQDCVCRGYSLGETHQQDSTIGIYSPRGTYAKRDHRVTDNAAFIAHAREDVPFLVKEVRALLAERDALAADAKRREAVIVELRDIGGLLANAAFNLAQNSSLRNDTRRRLDDARRQWDAAMQRAERGTEATPTSVSTGSSLGVCDAE